MNQAARTSDRDLSSSDDYQLYADEPVGEASDQTQVVSDHYNEADQTRQVPVQDSAPGVIGHQDLVGHESDPHTRVIADDPQAATRTSALDDMDWDEQRRAREEALGVRQRPVAQAEEEPQSVAAVKHSKSPISTDWFLQSLGLFVLRIVVAGIMALHGVAKLLNLGGVETMLANTVIPYPPIMALVLAISELLIAVALLLGVLVRVAGLGVASVGIGALVFVLWTTFPFQNGYELTGELELLLGAVGVLFLLVGGGRWGIDGSFRASRRRNKELAAAEQATV